MLATVWAAAVVFARPYTFHGSLIEPPAPAPDFALSDQNGNPFRLSDQNGSIVLMFFGYTTCPDVCPATLAQLKQVRADLGRDADAVRVVLVTVDPGRDTAEQLRNYLSGFDPAFIGLTGSFEQLDIVYRSYGVYQAIPQLRPGYTVEHTDRIYVIDAKGNLRLTYTTDTASGEIAGDVRELLKGN